MTNVSFLRSLAIFSNLAPSELEPVADKLRRRTFQRGEVIFHQDDPGDRLHFLEEGMVKISLVRADGRENDIMLLTPGDCFGEMSVLDGGTRSAKAVAMETTETMTLSREEFLEFLNAHSQVAIEIVRLLVKRLRITDEMIGDLVFLDVPTRVAKKVLELSHSYGDRQNQSGNLTVPIGQEELSRLVGSSRETVSRALSAYRRMGLLSTSHRRITITDLDGLQKMAAD